jgi:hypothetical protein
MPLRATSVRDLQRSVAEISKVPEKFTQPNDV